MMRGSAHIVGLRSPPPSCSNTVAPGRTRARTRRTISRHSLIQSIESAFQRTVRMPSPRATRRTIPLTAP
jgi:hypothetical protein